MPYKNPVYPHEFADPFVLKTDGEYWGYSTGLQPDGGAFGVFHSPDLVHWERVGSAIQPLPGGHPCYWAPEVVESGEWRTESRLPGYLMYYSVGNEETMAIRVAGSDKPQGPFEDLGVTLTKEPFAIDPHVFVDDDGSGYLFYATDFLTHTHIGTGTVVDRMIDPLHLEGKPEPVTRARYEWQVYDPKRESKGGVKWHTVEGPFVLKHNGKYYQMFSGGNWQNLTYGVSYAVSDTIKPGHEWKQHADGAQVLPILRTLPGKVIGPGHNSVVVGPDDKTLYCVYHSWHDGKRVLCIDRLKFVGDELIVHGPTTEEQPGP
jgi:beta-xylosidase